MSAVEWEEPPPSARSPITQQRFVPFIEELQANPKRWARYPHEFKTREAASAKAYQIRKCRSGWTYGPGFEATNRGPVVYIRWVGES